MLSKYFKRFCVLTMALGRCSSGRRHRIM